MKSKSDLLNVLRTASPIAKSALVAGFVIMIANCSSHLPKSSLPTSSVSATSAPAAVSVAARFPLSIGNVGIEPVTTSGGESINVTRICDQGSARGTAYGMNSMIASYQGKTHIAFLDSHENIFVRTFTEQDQSWSPAVKVGSGQDNHAAPSLLVDSKGFLHLIFGPHHSSFSYRKSLRPNDTSEWTPRTYFGEDGTYASPVIDKHDVIHVVYRGKFSEPYNERDFGTFNQLDAAVYQKKVPGQRWSKPRYLANGSPDALVSYNDMLSISEDQTLHFAYNFYSGYYEGQGLKVGYMRSKDSGVTWENVAGSKLTLPVSIASSPSVVKPPRDTRMGFVVANTSAAYIGGFNMKGSPRFSVHKMGADGKTDALDLSNIVGKDFLLDSGSVASISDDGNLWIAMAFAPVHAGGWASENTGIALVTINLADFSNASVKLYGIINPFVSKKPGGNREPSWLPSLERRNSFNSVGLYPRLLFTSGPANNANTLDTSAPTELYYADVRTFTDVKSAPIPEYVPPPAPVFKKDYYFSPFPTATPIDSTPLTREEKKQRRIERRKQRKEEHKRMLEEEERLDNLPPYQPFSSGAVIRVNGKVINR